MTNDTLMDYQNDPWAPDSYEQEVYDMTYGTKYLS